MEAALLTGGGGVSSWSMADVCSYPHGGMIPSLLDPVSGTSAVGDKELLCSFKRDRLGQQMLVNSAYSVSANT